MSSSCEVLSDDLEHNFVTHLDLNDGDGESKASISHQFIKEFDFTTLTKEDIEAFKNDSTFKVMMIANCPKLSDFLCKIRKNKFGSTMTQSTHLFVIIIKIRNGPTEMSGEILSELNFDARPLLIQVLSEKNESTTYYKEALSEDFIQIRDFETTTLEKSVEEIEAKTGCNIYHFLQALKSNVFGSFNGNLLDTKIDKDNASHHVRAFMAKHNVLCARFFQLFLPNSKLQIHQIPMIESLQYAGVENFSAVLDLPFSSDNVIDAVLQRAQLKNSESTEGDEIKFLVNFWKAKFCKKNSDSHLNLERNAQILLEKLSVVDDTNLNGIPLKVLLVAEVYDGDESNIEALDLHSIYTNFIDKVIERWMKLKGIMTDGADKGTNGQKLKWIKHLHSKASLPHCFTSVFFHKSVVDAFNELPRHKFAEIGFLRFEDDSNRYRFIHKTFAEYFTAEYMTTALGTREVTSVFVNPTTSAQSYMIVGLFCEISQEPELKMVRAFMNKTLKLVEPSDEQIKDFCYDYKHRIDEAPKVFLVLLEEKLDVFLDFVVKNTICTIGDLLPILVCPSTNIVVFDAVWNSLKANLTEDRMKNFCFDRKSTNVLRFAFARFDDEILLRKVFEMTKTIFNVEERKEMLKQEDKNGTNLLHTTAGSCKNKKAIEALFSIIKEVLDGEEQKLFIQSVDEEKSSAFHFAATNNNLNDERLSTLWNCMKNFLTEDEIKNLFRQKNVYETSVLHAAILKRNSEAMGEFLNFLKQVFTIEEQRQLLTVHDNSSKKSALSLASSENKDKDVLEGFWAFAKELLTADELKKLLLKCNGLGKPAVYIAVQSNNVTVLPSLFNIITTVLDVDEQKILFRKLEAGNISIFLRAFVNAAKNSEAQDTLTALIEFTTKIFTKDEFLTLMEQKDDKNLSVSRIWTNLHNDIEHFYSAVSTEQNV